MLLYDYMYYYHGNILYSLIGIIWFKVTLRSARLQLVLVNWDPGYPNSIPPRNCHTPDYSRNSFGVVVRGDPWNSVLSALKRGWLALFRRVLFKQMMKCCLYFSLLSVIFLLNDVIFLLEFPSEVCKKRTNLKDFFLDSYITWPSLEWGVIGVIFSWLSLFMDLLLKSVNIPICTITMDIVGIPGLL